MKSTETTITAQFYDLDPMDVVWHGNYARFLEQARCDLLNSINYNYNEMKNSGHLWPIVDMQTKYVRPIRFGQSFKVVATIIETANRLKINYVLSDKESGELLTKASTTQVAVDAATGELLLVSPKALTDLTGIFP